MTFKIREILFGLKWFLLFMQVNVTDLRSHGESGKGRASCFSTDCRDVFRANWFSRHQVLFLRASWC